MHLLNAAVAVASALAGTVGATVAYGALNTAPIGHTEPMVEPVTLTHYLPCEPPSKLTNGVCVTTVVKTVVKTAAPIVITTVEKSRPSKGKASTPAKATAREKDHEDEGEDHDEGDHGEDHGDD
ncbi:MAG: hypothetical protein ACOH1Y_04315 [Propionicimonas sp.]